jgi:hypothetical protein
MASISIALGSLRKNVAVITFPAKEEGLDATGALFGAPAACAAGAAGADVTAAFAGAAASF